MTANNKVRPSRISQALTRTFTGHALPALGGLLEVIEINWSRGTNIADAQNWLLTLIPEGEDKGNRAQHRVLSLHALRGGDALLAKLMHQ